MSTVYTESEIESLLGEHALARLRWERACRCSTQELAAAAQLANRGEVRVAEWIDRKAVQPAISYLFSSPRTRRTFTDWLNAQAGGMLEEAAGDEEEGGSGIGPPPKTRTRKYKPRKTITDPTALEKRRQALLKARAARAAIVQQRREAETLRNSVGANG